MFDSGLEALAILCRAAEMPRADFARVALLVAQARNGAVQGGDYLDRILNIFDDISEKRAIRLLKFWESTSAIAKASDSNASFTGLTKD